MCTTADVPHRNRVQLRFGEKVPGLQMPRTIRSHSADRAYATATSPLRLDSLELASENGRRAYSALRIALRPMRSMRAWQPVDLLGSLR